MGLVPLEILQKASFNLSSYKTCPLHLAYSVQKKKKYAEVCLQRWGMREKNNNNHHHHTRRAEVKLKGGLKEHKMYSAR